MRKLLDPSVVRTAAEFDRFSAMKKSVGTGEARHLTRESATSLVRVYYDRRDQEAKRRVLSALSGRDTLVREMLEEFGPDLLKSDRTDGGRRARQRDGLTWNQWVHVTTRPFEEALARYARVKIVRLFRFPKDRHWFTKARERAWEKEIGHHLGAVVKLTDPRIVKTARFDMTDAIREAMWDACGSEYYLAREDYLRHQPVENLIRGEIKLIKAKMDDKVLMGEMIAEYCPDLDARMRQVWRSWVAFLESDRRQRDAERKKVET